MDVDIERTQGPPASLGYEATREAAMEAFAKSWRRS
jgi:hypothetical protein